MRSLALLCVWALCGVAVADIGLVQRGSEPVPIISQNNEPSIDGRFNWGFQSADGTNVNQEGVLEPSNNPNEGDAVVIRGSYTYRADDGREITVRYVADRFGYRPESDIIAPAIQQLAQEARNLPPLPPDEDKRSRGRN